MGAREVVGGRMEEVETGTVVTISEVKVRMEARLLEVDRAVVEAREEEALAAFSASLFAFLVDNPTPSPTLRAMMAATAARMRKMTVPFVLRYHGSRSSSSSYISPFPS